VRAAAEVSCEQQEARPAPITAADCAFGGLFRPKPGGTEENSELPERGEGPRQQEARGAARAALRGGRSLGRVRVWLLLLAFLRNPQILVAFL